MLPDMREGARMSFMPRAFVRPERVEPAYGYDPASLEEPPGLRFEGLSQPTQPQKEAPCGRRSLLAQ